MNKKKQSLFFKLSAFTSVAFLFFYGVLPILAAPPASPYNPGDTLNPNCGPGDPNCTVNAPLTGSGTQGYIPFYSASSTVATSTASFFWDNTNGRLGVGTSAPTNALTVFGNIQISSSTAKIIFADGTTQSTAPATGSVGTSTNVTTGYFPFWGSSSLLTGTSTMYQSAGNVGIGTTAPAQKLDVTGNGNLSGSLTATALYGIRNTESGQMALGYSNGGSSGTVNFDVNSQGSLLLSASSCGGSCTSALPSIAIDALNTRIGIGTTAPSQKLDVAGNINISSSSAYMYNGVNVITAQTALLNYFFGEGAGNLTMTGDNNVASGYNALPSNTTGIQNTASGVYALRLNSTGSHDTANGSEALYSNTTGSQNTADGFEALYNNTTGANNTGNGVYSLYNNSTGSSNVALGYYAGAFETGSNSFYVNNINQNTSAGDKAYSLLYGTFSGTTGSLVGQQLVINGNVGIGLTAPTAYLNIKAGTAAVGTAPLKFTSGTNLTTAETGAMEYDGTNLYFTPTGTTRKTFAYTADLTAGYIPYTGGNANVDLGVHNLTVDTNSLFVDATNHRVGIGTTAPGNNKLDIAGDSNKGVTTALYVTNDSNTAIFTHGNTAYRSSIGFDSSNGNPFIGLHAEHSTTANTYRNDGTGYKGFVIRHDQGATNGINFLWNGVSTADTDFSSTVSSLYLQSSGNVGIGTTAPLARLQVTGLARVGGEPTARGDIIIDQTLVGATTAGGLEFKADLSGSGYGSRILDVFDSSAAYDLQFQNRTNSASWTTGMTLKSNGNVGIGTTAPATALEVVGSVTLATTSSPTTGVIYKGATQFIHDFALAGTNGANTFVGINSGNFTMTGSAGSQGSYNAGFGVATLHGNTTGYFNAAFNANALSNNTSGYSNSGIGYAALLDNTTGYQNVAVGTLAGYNSGVALQTMHDNTFLGYSANASVDAIANSMALGSGAQVTKSNLVVIGNASVTETWLRGNVGIGTTAPGSLLHLYAVSPEISVAGSSGGNPALNLYYSPGGSDVSKNISGMKIYYDVNTATTYFDSKYQYDSGNQFGNIQFRTAPVTGGVEVPAMTIQGGGNVGIGTTAPGQLLQIDTGSATRTGGLAMSLGGTTKMLFGLVGTASQWSTGSAQNDIVLRGTNNNILFSTDDGTTTQMYLKNGGNVGIGTSTPAATLQVFGNIKLNLTGTGTANALCHTTQTGTTTEEIVDCTSGPTADYMELYPVATGTELGDVMMISSETVATTNGNRVAKLVKTNAPYQANVLGVVSDSTQASDFNSVGRNIAASDNPMPIALSGRVPVKVSLENGPIAPGDYLTASARPGFAMKATDPGMTIGIALESYTEQSTSSTVMIFVENSFSLGSTPYRPAKAYTEYWNDATSSLALDQFTQAVQWAMNSLGVWIDHGIAKVKELFAEKVTTKELCLEDVCVGKDQLKALLDNQGSGTGTSSGSGNSGSASVAPQTPPDTSSSTDSGQATSTTPSATSTPPVASSTPPTPEPLVPSGVEGVPAPAADVTPQPSASAPAPAPDPVPDPTPAP